MTLTIDIEPEVEGRLAEAARRQGQTLEKVAAATLRAVFVGSPVTLDTLLTENTAEDGEPAAFTDALFHASAEATRHIWDTPEEDSAWAHLQ